MAGLWIWALASGVSRKMNPNKTRAASGQHRSSNLSVFFPGLQCEEEHAVTQLPVDHRRAMKISTTLFSTVDQVSAFVHFYWPVTKQYRISEAEHNCKVLLLVFSDAAFLATCKRECEHRLQAWVNLNSTSKLFCFHLLLHLINSISLPLQRQHMLIPGRSPELLNNEHASGQCFSKFSNSNSAAFLGSCCNLYSAKVINVISW